VEKRVTFTSDDLHQVDDLDNGRDSSARIISGGFIKEPLTRLLRTLLEMGLHC
jgi:hypothetical protein